VVRERPFTLGYARRAGAVADAGASGRHTPGAPDLLRLPIVEHGPDRQLAESP
jgi:hypothetical protein